MTGSTIAEIIGANVVRDTASISDAARKARLICTAGGSGIRTSRIINFAAGASFMVYLIHDNPFVRNYWCYADDWVSLIHNNVIMFPVKLFGRAVLIYLMGIVVYLLYKAVLWALGKMRPLFWKKTL